MSVEGEMRIRSSTLEDHDEIHALYLAAFPEEERQLVADLAVRLIAEPWEPPTISLVATDGSRRLGHVAFSPITSRNDASFRGFILAPLAVHPDAQKAGIGSRLILAGLDHVACTGAQVVLVYGDPDYYSRAGFLPDALTIYRPPHDLQYPLGWQHLPLADTPRESPIDITCVEPLDDPRLW